MSFDMENLALPSTIINPVAQLRRFGESAWAHCIDLADPGYRGELPQQLGGILVFDSCFEPEIYPATVEASHGVPTRFGVGVYDGVLALQLDATKFGASYLFEDKQLRRHEFHGDELPPQGIVEWSVDIWRLLSRAPVVL